MDQKAQAPNASHATDAPPKPVLDYPFEAPPQRGQTLEVAPGVLWIRMPLPYALDHINLWAIDDGQGWAIVDTGARTDEGVATDRKSTRLNSSHQIISYAVFCLKKKKI